MINEHHSHEHRDKLDSILDAALREYSNREPGSGFEERVLLRIQATQPPPRRWWGMGWALAPVALAIIALAVVAPRDNRTGAKPKTQPLAQIRSVAKPPVQALPAQVILTLATRKPTVSIRKHNELPRLEKFPEPEPLTPEERALLRFVQSQPEMARAAFTEPAQIEALTIDPIQIEELP